MRYSNRRSDSISESIVSKLTNSVYLDYGYKPTWINDPWYQLRGIDVVLMKDGIEYTVDEKAAVTRLDGNLNTFAFELYTSNNKGNIGWFVNKNCINNYYSLIYLTSFTNNIREINKIECILLNKYEILHEVKKELNNANIHFNNILSVFDGVERYRNGRKYIYLNKYMKIVYSMDIFPEMPINVLIDKEYLLSLSTDILVKSF